MRVAMYLRVGNKEQLDVETDMKKKEQEFESFCERKKYEMIGEYMVMFPVLRKQKATVFQTRKILSGIS